VLTLAAQNAGRPPSADGSSSSMQQLAGSTRVRLLSEVIAALDTASDTMLPVLLGCLRCAASPTNLLQPCMHDSLDDRSHES
jgi:hypothetical protein